MKIPDTTCVRYPVVLAFAKLRLNDSATAPVPLAGDNRPLPTRLGAEKRKPHVQCQKRHGGRQTRHRDAKIDYRMTLLNRSAFNQAQAHARNSLFEYRFHSITRRSLRYCVEYLLFRCLCNLVPFVLLGNEGFCIRDNF
jgi:hypothetical protein